MQMMIANIEGSSFPNLDVFGNFLNKIEKNTYTNNVVQLLVVVSYIRDWHEGYC